MNLKGFAPEAEAIIRKERQIFNMIKMAVRNKDIIDSELLLYGESTCHGGSVNKKVTVDQERGSEIPLACFHRVHLKLSLSLI